jgi:hypothetical protein
MLKELVTRDPMSIADKFKEAKDKLKDKLKGHEDLSASVKEHEERAEVFGQKAKEDARSEAQYETGESQRIAKDVKEDAKYQTSESERIARSIKGGVDAKAAEAKQRFDKH